MNATELIQSITKELKTLLVKGKKEIKVKGESLKKTRYIHE